MSALLAFIRAWWLPTSLGLVTIANVASGVYYQRFGPKDALYRLSTTDKTLPGSLARKKTFFRSWYAQLYEIQSALAGSVLVVPRSLELKPVPWRMIALVELREIDRKPIPRSFESRLRARARPEALRLGPHRIFIPEDLPMPAAAPLDLFASIDGRSLFVLPREERKRSDRYR